MEYLVFRHNQYVRFRNIAMYQVGVMENTKPHGQAISHEVDIAQRESR